MTAILGKGALLNCRVRGIGNRTVCIAQNSFVKMFFDDGGDDDEGRRSA